MAFLKKSKNKNNNRKSLLLNFVQAQPSSIAQDQEEEQEALSSSVNLEDITNNHDVLSRGSESSVSTYLRGQFSQTYFSAIEDRNEDTISFQTALSSVFPSSIQEDIDGNTGGAYSLRNNSKMTIDKNTESEPSHFQVYWEDLDYRIESTLSLSFSWNNVYKLIRPRISDFKRIISPWSTSRSYNFTTEPEVKNSNEAQPHNTEPITIINQINGSFKSGELTAVMGPSGAGKTSLLNFLSRQREDGYSGQLYAEDLQHRIKISTIPQHDTVPEYLTVRENLMFASRLKNTQRNYDQEKNIQRVSNLLGLDDCLDTMTKKISGGQQKRLAIAQELLSRPEILILDEPTSGLDSLTCYKTISVLKDLVRESARKLIDPIAIVVTIHQPEQEVFELFDKIYLMAPGGIAIYNGPPDRCTQFVEQYSGVKMIDEDYNPALLLIELASGEYSDEPIKKLEQQVRFEFKSAKARKKNLHINSVSQYDLQEVRTEKLRLSIDERIERASSLAQGYFWIKTRTLTERAWLSMVRDPLQVVMRILMHILLPISMAFIFGQEAGQTNACPIHRYGYHIKEFLSDDDQGSNNILDQIVYSLENTGIIFVLVFSVLSANIGAVTLNFTLDIQRSLKEFYNGWYSIPAYIIARIVSDIPMLILTPTLSIWLGYILTGQIPAGGELQDSLRILIAVVAVIFGSMIGQLIGMIVGAIYIGHLSTALFISQAAILPMVFLTSLVTRYKNMSKFVYALSYASVLRHMGDICIIARYGYNVCQCEADQITGESAKLLGVSDRLRSFVKYWMESQVDLPEEGDNYDDSKNSSQTTNDDLFQVFAKQISLYNTYGVEINSCKDMIPHPLRDLSLHEDSLGISFLALFVIWSIMMAVLFITVKLVIRFKTSL